MNFRSIRFKLITWYAGLLVVVFIILGALGYSGLKFYLKNIIVKESLIKRSRQVAGTISADYELYGEKHVVEAIIKHYAPELNNRFLRVTRDDGSVIYTSGIPQDGSFNPTNLPVIDSNTEMPYLREELTPDKNELLIYAMPLTIESGKRFVIEAGVSKDIISDPLRGLLFTLGIVLPIIIAVAILGGYRLVRQSLIPVERMTQGAERITSSNLSERLPNPDTGDEIERLSISLNNMIDRLEKAFHHITQFSADASHELRTPLTIMHCDLETVIQKPRLPEDVRDVLGSALGETERLAKIVDGLLSISRLDAGEARMEMAKLDLAALTVATVEQMRLLAEDKGITLKCTTTGVTEIEGDSARLKQVIVNLLDNAIKYTPEWGTITVAVSSSGDQAILEVTDTGIGITAESMPHIFERFYRTDKARSRQLGGCGLGLSIVKSICKAHGGTVSVRSMEGRGSSFRVELPLAHRFIEKPGQIVA